MLSRYNIKQEIEKMIKLELTEWEKAILAAALDGYNISSYYGVKQLRQKLQDAFLDEDFPASLGD